jgi:hypothetical protein
MSSHVNIFICYYCMPSLFQNVLPHFTHAILLLRRPRCVPLCVVHLSRARVPCIDQYKFLTSASSQPTTWKKEYFIFYIQRTTRMLISSVKMLKTEQLNCSCRSGLETHIQKLRYVNVVATAMLVINTRNKISSVPVLVFSRGLRLVCSRNTWYEFSH